MTQENKDKLIKYLCAALPYDTIVSVAEGGIDGIQWNNVSLNAYLIHEVEENNAWEYIKPYLRPMSSMTEEEKKEYELLANRTMANSVGFVHFEATELIEWLLKKHFDFLGLIPMDCAIDCTDLDIYKD